MPFTKPVTVVVDTSAVLQGGLDFLVRHLAPQARIKVPALVHMEVLNLGERYFSLRRNGGNKARMLQEHARSQGAQRVLVRVEMDDRVEIERPRLGADPLRGVIQPDSDSEDRRLGLQAVQRSFADRLILETAVQHRDRVAPGHSVFLMTADQGQARMATAEGLEPLYFDANGPFSYFGTALSGVVFEPFARASSPRLAGVSAASLLWEAAVTFGGARLRHRDTGAAFEVLALGQDAPWQAFQLREDLLWTRGVAPAVPQHPGKPASSSEGGSHHVKPKPKVVEARPRRRMSGIYSFSLRSMLRLIAGLHKAGSLTGEDGMRTAGVTSTSSYAEYYRFLLAGRFAARRGDLISKLAPLDDLFEALVRRKRASLYELLRQVPSFETFSDALRSGKPHTGSDLGMRGGAFPTYCALAEITAAGLRFSEEGIYGTPLNPTPLEFSQLGLAAYEAVSGGENLALTGRWLERLARHDGVHPLRARERLAEAHRAGYLRRFFEGSTPETRYRDRNLHVLFAENGAPDIRTVNLYHGDFLMPGRAAVGIRLLPGSAE